MVMVCIVVFWHTTQEVSTNTLPFSSGHCCQCHCDLDRTFILRLCHTALKSIPLYGSMKYFFRESQTEHNSSNGITIYDYFTKPMKFYRGASHGTQIMSCVKADTWPDCTYRIIFSFQYIKAQFWASSQVKQRI